MKKGIVLGHHVSPKGLKVDQMIIMAEMAFQLTWLVFLPFDTDHSVLYILMHP